MNKPRTNLASFAPKAAPMPAANGGTVEESAVPATHAAKYPKVSVYLSADEVRTLKLLGIETNQRVSDICAAAIRGWLETQGHARSARYKS